MYDGLEFDEEQKYHRKATQQRLMGMYNSIVSTMEKTYTVFKNDGHDVRPSFSGY